MLERLLDNPVFLSFVIVAIGYAVGAIKVFGISLGSSATLFVALLFGHFGLLVPKDLGDLGLVLFVYSVGLQAGPRFFAAFKHHGVMFAQIRMVVILSAAALTWAMVRLFDLPTPLAVGMFAGALTSTPGLAAATDALKDSSVSVGYGIAYPFGVIGVVLFVQILPRVLKNGNGLNGHEDRNMGKPTARSVTKQFRIENPQVAGSKIADLNLHSMTTATISRVWHEGQIVPALPDVELQTGDFIHAVGRPEELAKLEYLFGPSLDLEVVMKETENVVAREVFITESGVAGKTIAELDINGRYGVIVTRVWRENIDMIPAGRFRLEIGDLIRIVGSPDDCEAFAKAVGQHEIRIHETTILPFALGVVGGVIVGFIPIPLPGGITTNLGLAGGPLLVGLLLGYFRGVFRLRLRTPYAVRYLLRELGVVFFLAGAGTRAGEHFLEYFLLHGQALVVAGAVVTLAPMGLAYAIARHSFQLNIPSSLGTVCGSLTSTPGLGAVCATMDAEEPTLAYATVYPVALIAMTVSAQVLSVIL